ncbi:integrase/recombinase XerD [Methanolobus vulcani]|uniref:Integrase/recombinase XerD n=1 Tax=Methanolobus vulcani TaxID=38026 RepID=A0A7Z7AUR8_9EURY|nr:tyrosine-type recombinase/integrase [Methanolobus vulcani]SDF43104.1 integrase/recombinase XerD [Methanolobus vulcani]
MNNLIDDFVVDCKTMGYSYRTIESYTGHVKYYLGRYSIGPQIKAEDLQPFLIHLRDERNLTFSTINAYFASLSTFFDYLEHVGILQKHEIGKFRKRYLRRYKKRHTPQKKQLISIDKMRELIESADSLEHQTLMIFLAKTGIRRNELITLDRSDISLANNTVLLKPTPKRSNRLVYFDDECKAFLGAYLKTRTDKNPALFLSTTGDRISRNMVYKIITEYARKLGIHRPKGHVHEKFTPHCFRVWFTTHLRRSGMSKSFIQELRGDVRGEAIDIYDHIECDELKAAYMRHIPQLGLTP